jgi:outer membrane protein
MQYTTIRAETEIQQTYAPGYDVPPPYNIEKEEQTMKQRLWAYTAIAALSSYSTLGLAAGAAADQPGKEEVVQERITLQADAHFDFDKATLKPAGKQKLDEVVAKLQHYKEAHDVRILAYTDRLGSDAYNMRLSQARAASVKAYLVDHGIPDSKIEAKGMGKADPVVGCEGVRGRAKLIECLAPNRRAEVQILVIKETVKYTPPPPPPPAPPLPRWLVRLTGTYVKPNSDTSNVQGLPAGAKLQVDPASSATFTLTYMLTDNIGVELLGAVPFHHDIVGSGSLNALGTVATITQLPPVLSLQYHFNPGGVVRPYLGVGVNHTFFWDENATNSLNAALGGPTSVDASNSWGAAGQFGVDFGIDRNWFLNFDVRYISIDTSVKLKTNGETRSLDLGVNPWAISAGVGYRF